MLTPAGMDGGFAFGKESRLSFCWQADNGFSRTCEPHLCLQSKHKYSSNTPFRTKQKGHRFGVLFVLAGMDGFEPSKCQSQSLVPYRLATSQYCVSIVSHFILLVKHFIKKFENYAFVSFFEIFLLFLLYS